MPPAAQRMVKTVSRSGPVGVTATVSLVTGVCVVAAGTVVVVVAACGVLAGVSAWGKTRSTYAPLETVSGIRLTGREKPTGQTIRSSTTAQSRQVIHLGTFLRKRRRTITTPAAMEAVKDMVRKVCIRSLLTLWWSRWCRDRSFRWKGCPPGGRGAGCRCPASRRSR